ncbi:hypothetical protein [Phytohabitans suffuscus]|uniref:Uncharacterized protein n=1 Tax=Phytohabitans suffuscus TaxID=624315 RepID=A0A6F8YPD3_9ACTN|nr:hypothetical protein [Phytohabitans suffuscus]BCB87906.1 hypothetical protein Psuf_052190 [Phytohabitans suffuscus]
MADTVEIYVKYAGPAQELAHRVAEALDLRTYFFNGRGCVLPVDAKPWIGVDSWAHLGLKPTDLGRDGDPGLSAGTAYEPYEFELSLEFRAMPRRLGRAIFDRLTRLELPMAYGDSADVFADYLPGRGVREFSPGTSAEEDGRPLWREPALSAARAPAPVWHPGSGAVTVCETGGLLQFVPVFETRWLWPVASTRTSVGAVDIGLSLAAALGTTDRPGRDERDEVLARLAAVARMPTDEFLRRTVSFDARVVGDYVVAVAHTAHRDGAPGAVEELSGRTPAAAGPEPLGALVLDLVAALRARVPA